MTTKQILHRAEEINNKINKLAQDTTYTDAAFQILDMKIEHSYKRKEMLQAAFRLMFESGADPSEIYSIGQLAAAIIQANFKRYIDHDVSERKFD